MPIADPQWEALDAAERRQRILEAVKRLVLRESQVQPVVLLFEDLHWIDDETQTVLDSLVESLPQARVLLLVNYRPEYRHGWGGKSYYTQLRIDPLAAQSPGALLRLEAELLAAKGEMELAHERGTAALTVAVELGARPEIGHCHAAIGRIAARFGDSAMAARHRAAARAIFDALGMTFWSHRE